VTQEDEHEQAPQDTTICTYGNQSASKSILEHIETESAASGRATRIRKLPLWMTDYETNMLVEEDERLLAMMIIDSADPQTFEEAWAS